MILRGRGEGCGGRPAVATMSNERCPTAQTNPNSNISDFSTTDSSKRRPIANRATTANPTNPPMTRLPLLIFGPARSLSSRLSLFGLLLLFVTSVTSAPLRPLEEDTPLSVQDGHFPYSAGNGTLIAELAKRTFYQLEGAEMPSERIGPPVPITEKKKKLRKPGVGHRRKYPVSGRKEALQMLFKENNEINREQRCEGQKFKQRVKVPGCLTKTIINRFCHGACNSYFIPRMSSKKLKAVFKSCAACGPKDYDRVEVTLDCPGMNPPQVTRTVIKVKKCACMDVDLNS